MFHRVPLATVDGVVTSDRSVLLRSPIFGQQTAGKENLAGHRIDSESRTDVLAAVPCGEQDRLLIYSQKIDYDIALPGDEIAIGEVQYIKAKPKTESGSPVPTTVAAGPASLVFSRSRIALNLTMEPRASHRLGSGLPVAAGSRLDRPVLLHVKRWCRSLLRNQHRLHFGEAS